ncbi:hypothetical protein FN846DRAFT_890278 [Sphaerosporella brunnea]|uniref:Uncharacterized protein n=1 Tax=Sphaerosporella brunnea TaxID=1250544 RepID=A0A5J5EWJ6_9PEZI|nr:hypothetical protein FN846DRAFT_890278 [Sphaerosporella brunnea]
MSPSACKCPHGHFNIPFVSAENATLLCIDTSSTLGCMHPLSEHEPPSPADVQGAVSTHTDARSPYLPQPAPRVELFCIVNSIIYPKSPSVMLSPRNDTVRVLQEQILEHQLIHVRSTPISGRTVLSKLLHRFVQTNLPGMTTVKFSWPGNAPQDWTVKPYNWIPPRVSGHKATKQAPTLPFGSPSSQKTYYDYEYSAPLYLKAEQRVSMRPLTKTHTLGLPSTLTDEVEDFLFDVTAGHPGCSAALLDVLTHSEDCRQLRKEGPLISTAQ